MSNKFSSERAGRNIKTLSKFRMFWQKSREYPRENLFNDIVSCPVAILYYWRNLRCKIIFVSVAEFYVGAGIADGKVEIAETKNITIKQFHLSFKPAYQDYAYSYKNKSLIITDSSEKMGGSYRVEITPNIEVPSEL